MKNELIFITGIGTGIGKTLVSAIVTEALNADYWKPVQAGLDEATDSETVRSLVHRDIKIYEEAYQLQTPASPHLSAKIDNVKIDPAYIKQKCLEYKRVNKSLVIEGAGGLMVPLTDNFFFLDLIKLLEARVIIVASQYLGSINHSLLTAEVLKSKNVPVVGWLFNGIYRTNEEDILKWTSFSSIGRIQKEEEINSELVAKYAEKLQPKLLELLNQN